MTVYKVGLGNLQLIIQERQFPNLHQLMVISIKCVDFECGILISLRWRIICRIVPICCNSTLSYPGCSISLTCKISRNLGWAVWGDSPKSSGLDQHFLLETIVGSRIPGARFLEVDYSISIAQDVVLLIMKREHPL